MEELTHQQFSATIRKTLIDFNVTSVDEKMKNELSNLFSLMNHFYAFDTWKSKHIYSSLPKKAIDSKNIDNYLASQIKHIAKTMQICQFQFNYMHSYFELLGISFALKLLLMDKKSFIHRLHDLHMKYWTDLQSFNNPFELIRDSFSGIYDIKKLFPDGTLEGSDTFAIEFACSFLNMYSFLNAFNITEKRIQLSLSICLYQELCNLSLSKYKTKEITDTIMHHLDIDATINLRKIDNVHCIGKIGFHKIYGYDEPLIPVKFLEQKIIHNVQNQHLQKALKDGNEELAQTWEEIQMSMGIDYRVQKSRYFS